MRAQSNEGFVGVYTAGNGTRLIQGTRPDQDRTQTLRPKEARLTTGEMVPARTRQDGRQLAGNMLTSVDISTEIFDSLSELLLLHILLIMLIHFLDILNQNGNILHIAPLM